MNPEDSHAHFLSRAVACKRDQTSQIIKSFTTASPDCENFWSHVKSDCSCQLVPCKHEIVFLVDACLLVALGCLQMLWFPRFCSWRTELRSQ